MASSFASLVMSPLRAHARDFALKPGVLDG